MTAASLIAAEILDYDLDSEGSAARVCRYGCVCLLSDADLRDLTPPHIALSDVRAAYAKLAAVALQVELDMQVECTTCEGTGRGLEGWLRCGSCGGTGAR